MDDAMAISKSILAATLCIVSLAANAQSGLNFLGRDAISKFNEQDMSLMRGALGRALKSEEMDKPETWANKDSGASGSITPLRAFESKGTPCRELRVDSRHPTVKSQGVYTMCRKGDRWVFAPQ